jgi:hypothetical protein
MIVLAAGSIGLYAGMAAHYRLVSGDWIAAGILIVFVIGILLATSALVRRPGVAIRGLLVGLFIVLAWLTLSGFTFYDQILPDIVGWDRLVEVIVVPFVVGAAGTLWSRDPVVGRGIARLAAITAGRGLYVYETIAVAVIGGGGPFDEDGGGTLRGTISDRLGNNMVDLALTTMVVATIGVGRRRRRRPPAPPYTHTHSAHIR